MTIISLITAMSQERVIGLNNSMPWHLPEELQYFKSVTVGKPMIMGRKTFDSIGRRLLPGRKTIVLTRDKSLAEAGCLVANSVEGALQIAGDVPEVMVVGGAAVYAEFLPLAKRLYLSIILEDFSGDTYFPEFDPNQWVVVSEEKHAKFITKVLEKK